MHTCIPETKREKEIIIIGDDVEEQEVPTIPPAKKVKRGVNAHIAPATTLRFYGNQVDHSLSVKMDCGKSIVGQQPVFARGVPVTLGGGRRRRPCMSKEKLEGMLFKLLTRYTLSNGMAVTSGNLKEAEQPRLRTRKPDQQLKPSVIRKRGG